LVANSNIAHRSEIETQQLLSTSQIRISKKDVSKYAGLWIIYKFTAGPGLANKKQTNNYII